MAAFAFYALLIWPFVWENATQRYQTAWLIRIPKGPLQGLEVIGLLVLLLLVVTSKRSRKVDWVFVIPITLFTVHGAIMGLVTGSYPRAFAQVTYLTMRPFLVYFLVANFGLHTRQLLTTLNFYLIMAILDSLVSIGQFLVQGLYADQNAGLMYHPHTLGNFLALVILGVASYSWINHKKLLLLLLILLIPPILIGRSDKTTVLIGPFLLCTYLAARGGRVKHVLIAVGVSIPLAIGIFQVASRRAPRLTHLVTRLAENSTSFGPLLAYSDLGSTFKQRPTSIVVGLGPGNYGSIFNTFDPGARKRHRPDFSQRIFESSQMADRPGARLNIWSPRPSLFLAVLSEYGLVGLGVFLLMMGRFLWEQVRRFRTAAPEAMERWVSLALIFGMLYVLAVGGVTILDGFFDQANIFPLMIVGGILRAMDRSRSQHGNGSWNPADGFVGDEVRV